MWEGCFETPIHRTPNQYGLACAYDLVTFLFRANVMQAKAQI
jgi:hypothetical protein